MNQYENLVEKKTGSETIFEGNILHVYRDTVELPNGNGANREFIRHVGAVCVVPVTDDMKVIMEKQYRYPMDEVVTEIPAGKLDSKEEDHLEAAKRELMEETGYRAREWTYLGEYYPTCAYSDEKIAMYMARGLEKGQQKLDEDEFLNVEEIPFATLMNDVMQGKIPDGKSQTALLKVALLLSAMEKKEEKKDLSPDDLLFEEYKNRDDVCYEEDGKLYYRIVSKHAIMNLQVIRVPRAAFANGTKSFVDENGTKFKTKAGISYRFPDPVPEWYQNLADLPLEGDVKTADLGDYICPVEEA